MLLVEVLDECAVTAWAEHQVPLFVAYGLVLLVDGDDVGVVLLFREGYVQLDAEGALVVVLYLCDFAAESGAVFG